MKKSDPKGMLLVPKIWYKKFTQKINQNCVVNNVFEPQNYFHEDWLSFPVYGEKIILA
jgi:hypothetical protein